MKQNIFSSGSLEAKSDFYVEYKLGRTDINFNINSKTIVLHKHKLEQIIQAALNDLEINKGSLNIIDNGGQYFVLQARIEAAIKSAYPKLKKQSLPKFQEHSKYKSKKDRFRRSILYIPGNQAKLMLNAGIHKPDAIILDLEDSVAPEDKHSARFIVRNALRHLNFFGAERMVRINQGDEGLKDLEEVVPHNPHLILIPKVEEAKQLIKFEQKIKDICKNINQKESIYLMPIIESAKGILNSNEIAAASNNNVALAIGLEDYTADIGVQRTKKGKESLFARSQIINAARSANIQAIDTVYSDVADEEGLRNSVIDAKELGFDGKGCIHPRQIQPIHEELLPTDKEINQSMKIVLAFDSAKKKGLSVVSLGSKMIDPPVVKRAQNTMEMAILSGKVSKDWKNN